ncbi:UVS2 protein, partial [Polypterus senegalus]
MSGEARYRYGEWFWVRDRRQEEQGGTEKQHWSMAENGDSVLVNPPPEGTTFREGDIAVSQRRSPISCFARSCLWPKSVDGFVYVPYNLSSQYNDIEKMAIETGMQDIANGTCIRFVPRSHESNYLNIQSKTGCWSFLGLNGGAQPMSLQAPGCTWSGVAAHELMHALGFVHEQSRIDRDRYITILWENILKDDIEKMAIETGMQDIANGTCIRFVPRSHESNYLNIQSKTGYAYSEDGLPTILPKSNINVQIGQRFGPSPTDKLKINKLYKCALPGVVEVLRSRVTKALGRPLAVTTGPYRVGLPSPLPMAPKATRMATPT